MRANGRFFDGQSSRAWRAQLRLADGELRVYDSKGAVRIRQLLDTVEISSRLGKTPRFITFSNGQRFETPDNDAIDQMLDSLNLRHGLLHRFESSLKYALIGLVVLVAATWIFVQWGIPAMSRAVAYSLPDSIHAAAETSTIQTLDRNILRPTELSIEKQMRLQKIFAPIIKETNKNTSLKIRVEFRNGKKIGANAMALPGGLIIFTDQIVEKAENDEELMGVLAHEIGHVVHHHGMQSVVSSSTIGLLAIFVTGDVSVVSSAISALPVILLQSGYSRNAEREADQYAIDTLLSMNVPPQRLIDILTRISMDDGSEEDRLADYMRTHPRTSERRAMVENAVKKAGQHRP